MCCEGFFLVVGWGENWCGWRLVICLRIFDFGFLLEYVLVSDRGFLIFGIFVFVCFVCIEMFV